MSKEIRARVEKSIYLAHIDQTEITVSVVGEVRPERSEIVVVTLSEGAK